jgi:PAS domain S-box-containing protein
MKTKKILIFVLVLLAFVVGVRMLDLHLKYNLSFFDYYKYNSAITLAEEAFLQEKPLLVGVYNDSPLAFLNEFNNYNAGIVVDYLSQLAIELRNDILLKVVAEDQLSLALDNGDVDVAVIERTSENTSRFLLSQPLCIIKGKILVRNNSDIASVGDLENMSLVTLKSDNAEGRIQEFFKGKSNVTIIEVENIYQCFALINKDFAVGYVGDDMEAAHFLSVTKRESQFTFLNPVLYQREICLATRLSDRELSDVLNKGILELKKKNLIAQTQYKWLGDYDSATLDLRQLEMAYRILLGIILIVVVFSSWNYVITQRVNTRTRELSESREELRLIIDTMQSGIMVVENDATIVECNEAMEKLAGRGKGKLIGENYNQIDRLKPLVDEANMNRVYNYRNAYYYITSQSFASNKKMIIVEDYTEKYVHEKTARQEAKMIAVGQLSAGLAHEIRNPLGLIKSYSYIIEKYCDDETGGHALSVINDSVGRINNLIENLLRFSKLSNDESMLVDIEKLINVIVELESKNIESNEIAFSSKVIGSHIRPILMNEDVLKVILLNLINNSIDACAGIEREVRKIDLTLCVEGDLLEIRIKDNGCGIAEERLENIFDPFYSSKETGTGLGLYIISTEISKNDGRITVESIAGQGTEFHIILPIKG